MFDYIRFFETNNIQYWNESTNQITLHCPWCGSADPSHHLAVNTKGEGFKCFRQPSEHKGKNPARLVQAVLGCSWDQANAITGGAPQVNDFAGQFAKLMLHPQAAKIPKPPRMPKEFRLIVDKKSALPFLSYLEDRGFDRYSALRLAKRYDLHYCKHGPDRGRIIFPVYRHDKLMTWTGRTIINDNIRYKTHSTDLDIAQQNGYDPAAENIVNLLLWHDQIEKSDANILTICEGPFDALKINHLGALDGVCATCLFTHRASETQTEALRELSIKFKHVALLLDQKTFDKTIAMSIRLPNLKIVTLPKEIDDPGDIKNKTEFRKFFLDNLLA